MKPKHLLNRLLAAVVLFLAGIAHSQPSASDGSVILKIAPGRLIHPMEPGIDLVGEYRYGDHWGTQATLGIVHRFATPGIINDQSGFSAGVEQRYYFIGNGINSQPFVGLGISHTDFSADCTATFRPQGISSDSLDYNDNFRLEKTISFLTFRYGVAYSIGDHFGIELSAALSLIYRNARHYDRQHPDDRFTIINPFIAVDNGVEKGAYWFLRAPCQLRISIVL